MGSQNLSAPNVEERRGWGRGKFNAIL